MINYNQESYYNTVNNSRYTIDIQRYNGVK